jgi:hypothetical protein
MQVNAPGLARTNGRMYSERPESYAGRLRDGEGLGIADCRDEYDVPAMSVGGCSIRLRQQMVAGAHTGSPGEVSRLPVHATATSAQGRNLRARVSRLPIVQQLRGECHSVGNSGGIAASRDAWLRLPTNGRENASPWGPSCRVYQLPVAPEVAHAIRAIGGLGGEAWRGCAERFTSVGANLFPASQS